MDRYKARGVSAQKEDVHAVFSGGEHGLFPQAFCKIVPDALGGSADWCVAMHADGTGTKPVIAYLYYRETGDISVFEDIAQDAVVMNTDDLLCVGALGPYMLSNTISRHARRIPGEVLRALQNGMERQVEQFRQWDMHLSLTGGETEDVGDVVGTMLIGATVTTRLRREQVVTNGGVRPGQIIIGLSSAGQTAWETRYNSGMGCNGMTSARHDLLHKDYGKKYPETYDNQTPESLRYSGPFHLTDPLQDTDLNVGQAILSPTRTYAPVVKMLLKEHHRLVGALVHCTGGGQTKCLRTGQGIHYVKDEPFTPPPLFQAIRKATDTSWREMYRVFNMGHRLEVIGDPKLLPVLQDLGQAFALDVQQVGYTEASTDGSNNWLSIHTPGGLERYSLDG